MWSADDPGNSTIRQFLGARVSRRRGPRNSANKQRHNWGGRCMPWLFPEISAATDRGYCGDDVFTLACCSINGQKISSSPTMSAHQGVGRPWSSFPTTGPRGSKTLPNKRPHPPPHDALRWVDEGISHPCHKGGQSWLRAAARMWFRLFCFVSFFFLN